MNYTDEDLKRAEALWSFGVSKPIAPTRTDIAELIATVRRETVEACGEIALRYAEQIRADIKRRIGAGLQRHLVESSKIEAATTVAFRIRALARLDEFEDPDHE